MADLGFSLSSFSSGLEVVVLVFVTALSDLLEELTAGWLLANPRVLRAKGSRLPLPKTGALLVDLDDVEAEAELAGLVTGIAGLVVGVELFVSGLPGCVVPAELTG